MRFKTKKEILEYLGKNWKDNKLIDRMILRGEAWHDIDGYYLIDDNLVKIEELQRIVKEKEGLVLEFARRNNTLEHEIDNLKGNEVDEREISKEILRKVYKYLTNVLRLRVDYDEFEDWINNN